VNAITPAIVEQAATTAPDLAGLPGKPRRPSTWQTILSAVALIATVAGVYYGQDYYRVGQFLESTDNAYVKANFTIVAPKVSGYITEVLVEDNQSVKAGQPVARIDPRDFQAALDQAKANVAAAESRSAALTHS
jgi:membrane fusion protein (multidrug efflux system)